MLLKWVKRVFGLLLLLILLYGVGRFIDVYSGSFYTGERAPYLMMPAPSAMTIRWQSEDEYIGTVRYGLEASKLNNVVQTQRKGEEHEVRITGLKAGTRYFYSAGTEQSATYKGQDFWFVTPPEMGQATELRFAVLGDPGYAGQIQTEVRDALLEYLNENPRDDKAYLDLLLTTGDNAYKSGSNKQFQKGFFAPFSGILRNIPIWPVYGNHDDRRWAFYDIFSLPQQAESGGHVSTTESYYSFDHSNVHFVILDSQASDMSVGSEMLEWLEQDLIKYKKNKKQDWLIVAFHHPPYTKGSHNSDSRRDSHGRLFEVRENVLPILEQFSADLVLSGHSHMYERSHLLACHYGKSGEWREAMKVNKNDNTDFTKPVNKHANQGTVYAVVGSSSKLDQGPLNHPAMDISLLEAGSLLVDINGKTLSGEFISRYGIVLDQFSITKKDIPARTLSHCK
ncbi:MAG: metallophosphoesterase family protein [Gammaproteobacteria bacterium]|nr:metallophosphoesterase family protein [Gammaproteobacteria bacterium]